MERLPVESMVAAAFMVYVGALGEDSRAEYLSDWESKLEARSIQNERFSFLNFTATESELLKLRTQGLGGDELSAENAMIILSSYKVAVPLITDPTQNAEVWLNRHLKEKGVQLTGSLDQSDLAFLHTLELSLRFGKTIFLALADAKVDPVLFPLLRGDCQYTGSRRVIQLAERSVDFSDDFCIFLTCRDPGILGSIPPDVRSLLIGVNFTVTRQGLIRQLLGIVLSHDRPELEERRKELLANEETLKSRLMDLEDELLEQLAAVEGDVLGNQKLMESLNRTKDSATSIAESLQESARLQDALDEQRAMFRSIAVEGSELFMLMSDMNKVGSMYRFSLTEFIGIFTASLGEKQSGGPDEDLDIRLNDISTRLKGNVLEYVSRTLFKRDRLTFAVMMARNAVAESIKENEWQLFMGNFVARDGISPLKEGHLSWCPVDRRAQLAKLVLALSELNAKAKMESPNLWRGWIEEDACEEKFPQEIALKLTSFQKVLIVQALRPDRLESALTKFTTEVIFLDYDCLVVLTVPSISPSTSSLHTLCQAAEGFRPILFIVTPGADPTRDLTELAASTGQKLVSMAIGGGNEQDALEMLRNGMVEGHWVLIMNLHLALAWAGKIEVELRNGKPHRDFRCWLTTEPRENFPPILLESSVKVAFEFPPGVRNNVKRICESWDTRWFEAGDVSRSQVLFLCACFHAAVQERTSFIPQGWTKDYEFSTADLKSACETALQALKDDGSVEWPTLRGILENAVYGCRVDNTFDLRLVRQYVKDIFAQQAIDNGGDLLPFRLPATTSLGTFKSHLGHSERSGNNQTHLKMAPNADRALQLTNSERVLAQIRMLRIRQVQPSGQQSAEGTIDMISLRGEFVVFVQELEILWPFWESRAREHQAAASEPLRPAESTDSPTAAFVKADTLLATETFTTVDQHLRTLQQFCSSPVSAHPPLTSDLISIADSLVRHSVPSTWSSGWLLAPEEPLRFLNEISICFVSLRTHWMAAAAAGDFPSSRPVDLGQLLRPGVFLSALKQQTARSLKVPLDSSLKLSTSFDCPEGTGVSAVVEDLQLEGCRLDPTTHMLVESSRQDPPFSPLPKLTLRWLPAHQLEAAGSKPGYAQMSVPLYGDRERRYFIAELKMITTNVRERILNACAVFVSHANSP
ncbi:Cytoplasmic dynein 2 heavy chain 1 [Perkinsus olseni]|uniref:Cytoplasmic dynein 2 heavy chain 1 n=1 Tax=Perkinsus olseni TaxID=32597 RepID=A0A7J6RZH5_PEROL|nr:Cytoplasmic dynein 2 heavy chain 1 [Perkinsus olseni]